nr:hypothetical protein [uncultured Butyrivibrio sp.]
MKTIRLIGCLFPPKNGWYDNKRRVYIIYGQKSLMKNLHLGRNKIFVIEKMENKKMVQ